MLHVRKAVELVSGARIWQSVDSARVFVSGDAAAIARARTAPDALVVPAATIDVMAYWGGLISAGVHASPDDLMMVLHSIGSARKNAVESASGAFVWKSKDGLRLFLSGDAAAVARARPALDAIVVPAATIDVVAHWGGLIVAAASTGDLMKALYGTDGDRKIAIERASGANIWKSKDATLLFLTGDAAAIARARARHWTQRWFRPTIDVTARWGGLISEGLH